MRATRAAAAGCLCLAGVLGGCSGDPALRVDPGAATVVMDDTAPVRVSGADPGEPVELTTTLTDGQGTTFRSHATYVAAADGTVDTGRDAPTKGDYEGAHPTGPVFALASGDDDHPLPETERGAITVRYSASQSGHADGTADQVRTLLPVGVSDHDTDLTTDGVSGTLYLPADADPSAAAVVVLGGSEGGTPRPQAALLAAHGHPALALAYFGEPGLPDQLVDVPVEYFGTALRWLAQQPGLADVPVVVMGASRGSEAALLTATYLPDLVDGVVLASATSFVNAGYPDTSSVPFTWRGRPVPHAGVGDFGSVRPSDPAADLDVAAIRGPVLMVCGEDDQLWPSCPSSRRIVRESGDRPRTVVAEPDAGHLVDFLVPGYPLASGTASNRTSIFEVGGTQEADALGRLDAWPQLLDFLDAISASSR